MTIASLADLPHLVFEHSWCMLWPGLSDDDLAHELSAAELFVLARQAQSDRSAVGEGFGLVLLVAQEAGTPVIAPTYSGSHTAYIEGVVGPLGRVSRSANRDPARPAHGSGQAGMDGRARCPVGPGAGSGTHAVQTCRVITAADRASWLWILTWTAWTLHQRERDREAA